VTAGASVHEGHSRHSHNKEIEVLKKTCINAGLVAAVAGAVLLGSGSAANADWGGCCGGDHHSNWHHSKNKNKNNNRINIRIRVRNNNFNDNEERRREFREEREHHDHDHGHHHHWQPTYLLGGGAATLPAGGATTPPAPAPAVG
jgi:hypothetical protein